MAPTILMPWKLGDQINPSALQAARRPLLLLQGAQVRVRPRRRGPRRGRVLLRLLRSGKKEEAGVGIGR